MTRLSAFVAIQLSIEFLLIHTFLKQSEANVSTLAKIYQELVTANYRTVRPRFTTLVRADSWSPREGPCPGRAYVNQIIRRVAVYQPRAIVAAYKIEEALPCAVETAQLLQTVQSVCATIPVVFGHDFTRDSDRWFWRTSGISIVPENKESLCRMGHTLVSPDFRQLPLQTHYGNEWYPSLAWRAAGMVDRSLKNDPSIAPRLESDDPLFTSLLKTEEFNAAEVSGDRLLGSSSVAPDLIPELRGRIVVIGFRDEPEAQTERGRLPAHVIHAAYIEAFLDGRYLKKVPWCVDILLSFLFWYYVEDSITVFSGFLRIIKGMALLMVLDLVLVQFGWYGDFALLSIAGMLLWSILIAYKCLVLHSPRHYIERSSCC